MKNGTLYAKRVKRLYHQLVRRYGKPEVPDGPDLVERLIVALLTADGSENQAQRAMARLREEAVDINEIRISMITELAAAIRPYVTNSLECAGRIHRALNAIFSKEHAVTLDGLRKLGRREARQYLESLDGVDAYAAASVLLWGLGGHAIPVSDRLYQAMGKAELIDPSATIAEVQAFLERNVSANDAKPFCLLMRRFVAEGGASSRPRAAKSGERRRSKAAATTGRKPTARSGKRAAKR